MGEILAFLELAAIWLLLSLRYSTLPAMIHSPINGGGNAHGFGDKNQLWLLAILSLIGYIFLTTLGRLNLPLNVPESTTPSTRTAVLGVVQATFLALKLLILTFVLLQIFYATGGAPSIPAVMAHRTIIFSLLMATLLFTVFGSIITMLHTVKKDAA
jgi:hypothetical protein